MEESLKTELQRALLEAEKTLLKMQKTKDAELQKIRIYFEREVSNLEKEKNSTIERSKREIEKANALTAKYQKIASEKTEQASERYREIASIRMSLMRERKRAEESENALAEFKKFASLQQRLAQSAKRDSHSQNSENQSIQNQLSEILAATRMAPFYEMLGLTRTMLSQQPPLNTYQPVSQSPMQAFQTAPQLQSQEVSTQSNNQKPDNYQNQTAQQKKYDNETTQPRNRAKLTPHSPAPAEVSIDELAKSLENAIEEKTGVQPLYSSNSIMQTIPQRQIIHLESSSNEPVYNPFPVAPETPQPILVVSSASSTSTYPEMSSPEIQSTSAPVIQTETNKSSTPNTPSDSDTSSISATNSKPSTLDMSSDSSNTSTKSATSTLDEIIEELDKEINDLKKQLNEE